MSRKPFFFRVEAGALLDFATDPDGESITLLRFAKDLSKGRSNIPFIQGVIDEATRFMGKKEDAGRIGGLAKASNAKAMLERCCSTPLASSSSSSSRIKNYSVEFEKFWDAYPRKLNKKYTWEEWQKLKPPLEDVLNALSWQVEMEQWRKEGGKYIPHPATYINQGRWEDESNVAHVKTE